MRGEGPGSKGRQLKEGLVDEQGEGREKKTRKQNSEETCPAMCLCISDTVSCSFSGLSKLPLSLPSFSVTLDLSHNHLSWLGSGSFYNMARLENLQISHNQLSTLRHDHSHPFLTMLDLSSNRMARLPWDNVKALPGLVQRGLYLHNNSLICDCSMYGVFWHWDLKGYVTVKDFRDEHTCSFNGERRTSIQFLRHTRFFHNCTLEKTISQPLTTLLSTVFVSEGDKMHLDCRTSLNGTDLSFTWLSPRKGYITQDSMNDTLISLFSNGTLEIQGAQVNDSGLYVCTAMDITQALNATWEVNVTVLLHEGESFNTGYTTLLGCLVTMVLILIYLYLTPCRCTCCKQPKPPGIPIATYDPSTLASVFSYSMREQPKIQTNKHVAFMEPMISDEGTEWIPES
ncbi:hypothetical protein Q5P01_007822 [Channa striata]|uniref:Ig-like domain-containing protein n=1 Tax=Channa striata TaxID=64152 RepID=A0AA88SWP0_CHASR|nr:hypothetical protein Q5P01_007822 [Channa striata]